MFYLYNSVPGFTNRRASAKVNGAQELEDFYHHVGFKFEFKGRLFFQPGENLFAVLLQRWRPEDKLRLLEVLSRG